MEVVSAWGWARRDGSKRSRVAVVRLSGVGQRRGGWDNRAEWIGGT
jgi:hypothetical protein